VQAPAGPQPASESAEKFVAGIILAAADRDGPDATGARSFELFAWIRGPHRSIGLGSRCLPPVLDTLRRELAETSSGPLALRVRYPKSGRDGDDDAERVSWLNFFALYDFRPLSDGEERPETVLELRFGAAPPSEAAGPEIPTNEPGAPRPN
jgi:hypothetical protein